MQRPAFCRIALLAPLLVVGQVALAEDVVDAHARSLAATCATCHGTAGESSAGMPRLAGMSREQMRRALQEYKTGSRAGTVMPQLAKGYTDAQIEAIATWYAAQSAR